MTIRYIVHDVGKSVEFYTQQTWIRNRGAMGQRLRYH